MAEHEERSFEEALARLEEIVRQMEQGEVALEQSLALFEEGVRLSRHCARKLDEAEKRIAVLTEGEDGAVTAADMETGEEIPRAADDDAPPEDDPDDPGPGESGPADDELPF